MAFPHVLSAAACFLASAASLAPSTLARYSIEDLAAATSPPEGSSVSLAGEVKAIDYRPQVLRGTSTYSFQLADGTGTIKVLSQLAMYFSPGDIVRVEGVYMPADSSSGRLAQIDATAGVIEVTEAAESELAKMFTRDPLQSLAVPTSVAETSWSRADKLASVVSAMLAFVAAGALLLRRRRFNVALSQVLVRDTWSGPDSLILVVRVASIGSLAPLVSECANLYVRGVGRVAAASVNALESSRAEVVVFPLPIVTAALLELRFLGLNPERMPANCRGTLILQDAPSRKSFRQRVRLGRPPTTSANPLPPPPSARNPASRTRPLAPVESGALGLHDASYGALQGMRLPTAQWFGVLILGFLLLALALSQVVQRTEGET